MIAQDASQRLPILYVLVDGDDTIWPTQGPLPEGYHAGLATFSQLIKRGNEGTFPPVGLCTGRELLYIIGAMRSLTLSKYFSIIESGLFFYSLALGVRFNHPLLTGEMVMVFREIRDRLIPQIIFRFPVLRAYLNKEVHIALERTTENINPEDLVESVKEMLSEFADYVDVTSSNHAIDILVRGINKGSALEELCRWAGISPGNLLVIGDSPNDEGAIRRAGYAGCPANAHPKIKELVIERRETGWVSEYPYVQGVVDIMDHFIPPLLH